MTTTPEEAYDALVHQDIRDTAQATVASLIGIDPDYPGLAELIDNADVLANIYYELRYTGDIAAAQAELDEASVYDAYADAAQAPSYNEFRYG